MKSSGRLTFIWIVAGMLIIVGMGLLALMFIPGPWNTVVTVTPGAFEQGASVTVTRFVLPATWTVAPAQVDQPHPTVQRLATRTPSTLIMPTTVIILPVIPSLTRGPTQVNLFTPTHIPMSASSSTPTITKPTVRPSATKKP